MTVTDLLRTGRRAVRSVMGRDLFYRREISVPRLRLGQGESSWWVCPAGLGPGSVVYSFGVGEDVSFELALIERFRLRVEAFDPTPRSLAWTRTQRLPAEFTLHELGLASWDGVASFTPPADPSHVSYSMIRADQDGSAIRAPVRRLATIAAALGHSRIHLLKLDIEGAEYAALPDCLSSGPRIDQILIEFHHRWHSVGIQETRRAMTRLREAGYRIAHVSPNGCEYALLHRPRDP